MFSISLKPVSTKDLTPITQAQLSCNHTAKILKILMGALAMLTATFLSVSQNGRLSKPTLINLLIQIWMLAALINRMALPFPEMDTSADYHKLRNFLVNNAFSK